MERKIGEIFKYGGKTLQVKESASNGCDGCFFDEQRIPCSKNVSGYCEVGLREDKKEIIFVEVQEQQAEKLKERKVGEVFEYKGKKLKVVETEIGTCANCFFKANCTTIDKNIMGLCTKSSRSDNKPVAFVEVKDEQPQEAEQPQETEEIKERKVGEVFEYDGKKLKVVEGENECDKCYFYNNIYCTRIDRIAGACLMSRRIDNKSVRFVEVTEEHETQQAEQPKLNLCEILKYCPQGETFWSPMLDGVKFSCIDEERQMIIVETIEGHFTWEINADGTISIDEVTSPEVMLYPSREQRDWTKAKYEKKERFDPKTLKVFDMVLVKFDCGV